MDNTILNGSKIRLYNLGNSESGSIQYTDSKLSIKGNSAGSGVLITDGKLYLKSGATTTSIIYDASTTGVTIADGLIHLGTGSSTSSLWNDNGNVHIDSGITVSNLNIEHTEGVAANILGRVQFGSGLATGDSSHALGQITIASGDYSHALGYSTIASGSYSHALGLLTIASGDSSHALGLGTIASGDYSHALGLNSTTGKRILALFTIPATSFSLSISNASTYFETGQTVVISNDLQPICSINITNVTTNAITASCSADYIGAEFYYIVANRYPYSGLGSHALGQYTIASGDGSHALGMSAQANGDYSHALGLGTKANGNYSHALGSSTIASGNYSHALGLGTTTSIGYQHATGKYNAVDNTAIFIVGTGSSVGSRANGFWVTLTGLANAGLGFSSSGYVRVGGDIRGTQITASVGVKTPTILVTSVTTASNLSVGNSTKVNNYPVVGMASGSLLVYNGTNITASVHTGDDFYGSWMSHAQCLARISLRI